MRLEDQTVVLLPLYSLHLSPTQLKTSVAEQKYQARIKSKFMGGVHSGVNGTPTFFINDSAIAGHLTSHL